MNTVKEIETNDSMNASSGGNSVDGCLHDNRERKRDHFVQFYEDDRFLVDSVAAFLGAGLGAGEGVIVVATAAHRAALADQLAANGVDLDAVQARRQYVSLDAAETLSKLMVDGVPDEARFMQILGDLVAQTGEGRRGLRAFGEMVALLWADGKATAAIRLEQLWNKLGESQSFSLFCAYPMSAFPDAANGKDFTRVCKEHSRVIPTEAYLAKGSDIERFQLVAELQQRAGALELEISRRQQAEEESRRRQEYLQAIIDNTPECVKIVARDGAVLKMNAAGLAMVEAESIEQVEGRPIFDLIAPEYRDGFRALHERVCAGRREQFEYEIIGLRKGRRWVETHAAPIDDPKTGQRVHLALTRDITERRSAVEAQTRLAAIVESSDDAIISKDLNGIITSWNKSAERLFGYTSKEAVGQPVTMLIPPERVDEEPGILARICQGQRIDHYETMRGRKDGALLEVSVTVSPIRDAEGKVIGASKIVRDVRERRDADRATQLLGAIVESSDDAIASKDLNGIITSWNRGAERLFGYRAEEIIGRSVTVLIPEGRLDEEPGILDRIRRGERIEHYETVRRRKDGTMVDVSLTVSPIRDTSGKVIGASKIARDITEKVRAKALLEQTVAERTVQLRDTVAELEAFSYSVAHDMRAPLRSMNSYSRFLEEDFAQALPPQGKDFLRRIAAGAERLDALITDVLNYSKVSRGEMTLEPVDVEKLTREIVDSYPDLHEGGATILVQSPIPLVVGNTAALTQCLSNLLSNAVKFVSPRTTPQVRVRAEKKAEYVRLWVEDNGIGISEEGQKRIFQMFQRLNPAGEFKGTGIGLTIVRKAAERMGGRVGVESQPGEGSRFWIELKRAA